MRLATATLMGILGLLAIGEGPAGAEYYCRPGFEPTNRGQCVATAARDEIQLYRSDASTLYDGPVVRRRHHRRHGLRARY